METFSAYSHAITSVVIYAVIAQVLNALTGIRKGTLEMAPGASHSPDYADKSWRLDRTYMNTVEMLAFYAAIVFAAILAGANPFWINLLASLGLLLRVAANFVYLRGIGKGYGGLRTQLIIGASAMNMAMAVLAILAVFG